LATCHNHVAKSVHEQWVDKPGPHHGKQLTALTEKICIITVDGRTLVGTLVSCDQVTNLVLKETVERVIRPQDDPEESSETPHGLYMIRGDNVVVCGLVDEAMDSSIDWTKVRGEVIGSTKHVWWNLFAGKERRRTKRR
jgi:U6 snRNA-associated Sm-like protein LSm8